MALSPHGNEPQQSDGRDRLLSKIPFLLWSMITGASPVVAVGKSDLALLQFTRPAGTTPTYAAGMTIAAAGGAVIEIPNFFRVAGGTATILTASLTVNLKALTAQHRLHFLNAVPVTVSADNAAWDARYADVAKRMGSVDLAAMTSPEAAATDVSSASTEGINQVVKAADGSRSLFIALKALTAYNIATTAGMGYTVKLTSYQD